MSTKRRYNEEDMDGKIMRIKLKDFLTYDDCEFEPGNKLNVILGPNGTGKSSIVCAICLGLAGKTQLLGRAKDISDYVKHHKNVATIEIELYKSDGPNLVVKRVITRGKSRSKWYLNGKETIADKVEQTVAKMNIQMGNLCQFLPQDRVAEFAKMNPQQLLEATEKAVGPDGMYEDHMELIGLRKQCTEMEHSINEKTTHKERIESSNERLEREVQRYQEREKHQEKIQLLEKKKPWVEYEEARKEFVEAKKAKKTIETRLKDARKINAPMEEKIKKCNAALKKTESKIQNLATDMNKNAQAIQKVADNLEKQTDKIENAKSEFTALKTEEASRLKKIGKLQIEIEALEKDYEGAPDPEELRPQSKELSDKAKAIHLQINELSSTKQEYVAEINNCKSQISVLKSKIAEVESVDNQKLETLRQADKQTYDAVLWLRSNKHIFKSTVYEPILTQISMKNRRDAMYLETIVSFNDMKAFVCQNRDDQNTFSNQTRDCLRLNVSAVCPPNDSKENYFPRQPLENIGKFGFSNYVTDLFDAPKTVVQYLCESYNLHNIPIGNNNTEKTSGDVIDQSNLNRFFTPVNMYTVKTSKYSKKKSTTVQGIRKNVNLLNVSVDVELKKKLDMDLSQNQVSLQEYTKKNDAKKKEIDLLGKQQEQIRNEQKEMSKQMKRRHAISIQLDSRKKRLNEGQRDGSDLEKAERQTSKKITDINKIRNGLIKDYQVLVQKSVDIGKEHLQMNMKRVQEKNELECLERRCRDLSEELKGLEEQLSFVSRGSIEAKNKARRMMEKARAATGEPDVEGELIPKAFNEAFEMLPDTVDEINTAIFEEQARLNCQYETNPSVIRDYERNKKEISRLETEINEQTERLEETKKQIDVLLERWLKPLDELIVRINEQYCDFFRRMGCAGQVTLEKDTEDDYKKYGVQIQVKFRAVNKMKALTSTFQSGGERSVSTMLYLISLQELTKCPFRLVDEINQGMDPNNERRVFELVVETVCRPNTSQYFLITPKLLPDLRYTEKMTILTVLNGHWMVPHSEFKLKDLIERKKRLPKTL